ncbi:MAG TPA: hypothetical protein VFQ43_07765, partial [Nitrososphaera sp.]|nr:hypothetical protein [Nitrososphaera sp.]
PSKTEEDQAGRFVTWTEYKRRGVNLWSENSFMVHALHKRSRFSNAQSQKQARRCVSMSHMIRDQERTRNEKINWGNNLRLNCVTGV